MNEDLKVIEIIENMIKITIGKEQENWVKKYEIFTLRNLFIENNNLEKLEEVNKIRNQVLHTKM